MAKIGLFFGSSTGKTEAVAYQLKDEFDKRQPGLVDVFNIGSSTPEQMMQYEYLIWGCPTWNTGQLQDDWEIFLPKIKAMNLTGKKLALFGLGDQNGYGFNFIDAIGMLADAAMESGVQMWGLWKTESYQFEESKAQFEDLFMGLAIDDEGQQDMTSARLAKWVDQLISEFALA